MVCQRPDRRFRHMKIQSGMINTIAVTVIRRAAPPKPYRFDPATTTSNAMNENGCPAMEIQRAIASLVVFQLFGEKGWTKSLVPANVATSEENHQRHRLHFAIPNM